MPQEWLEELLKLIEVNRMANKTRATVICDRYEINKRGDTVNLSGSKCQVFVDKFGEGRVSK